MPVYDFVCENCGKKFTRTMSLAEHSKGRFKCPKCGSGKVKQLISSFQAVTSRKS